MDEKGDALAEMKSIRQDKRTAEDFIEDWKILAKKSKLTDDTAIIDYLQTALNRPLVEKILGLENCPTTARGWYEQAIRLDNQYRRQKAIIDRLKGTTRRTFTSTSTQPRLYYRRPKKDPNAMDVDRMSTDERNDHMKKGLCFECHQTGHHAADYRNGNLNGKLKKERDVFTRLKAMTAKLDEEEKANLYSEMEKEGF